MNKTSFSPAKVEWKSRSCPLCGPKPSRVFRESNIDLAALDGFAFASRKLPEYMHPRLVECSGCGLLYGDPVLSRDTLATAYESADFDSGPEARYASITYANQIRALIPSLPDQDGTLDIGTGDGVFLERLQELGFTRTMGVEPSDAPRQAARADIKPLIVPGIFDPSRFQPQSFSLITCFQTMEHVSDPLETARGAYQLLKPGGAFVIVVHNRKAFSAKLLGTKSPIFDVEHLQLFCPATARRLFEVASYRNIRVSALWNAYPLHYWMKLLPIPLAAKRPLLRTLTGSAVGRIPIGLPAGNLVAAGFR